MARRHPGTQKEEDLESLMLTLFMLISPNKYNKLINANIDIDKHCYKENLPSLQSHSEPPPL